MLMSTTSSPDVAQSGTTPASSTQAISTPERPAFAVFVTIRKEALSSQIEVALQNAFAGDPIDVREYQGLLHLQWAVARYGEVNAAITALEPLIDRPEFVFVQIMGTSYGAEFLTLKDNRKSRPQQA